MPLLHVGNPPQVARMNEAMGHIWAKYKSKVNKGEEKTQAVFAGGEKRV